MNNKWSLHSVRIERVFLDFGPPSPRLLRTRPVFQRVGLGFFIGLLDHSSGTSGVFKGLGSGLSLNPGVGFSKDLVWFLGAGFSSGFHRSGLVSFGYWIFGFGFQRNWFWFLDLWIWSVLRILDFVFFPDC
jgi:hypothetical protein